MNNLTIKQLKAALEDENIENHTLEMLKNDKRIGVIKLLKSYNAKQEKKALKLAEFKQKIDFDKSFSNDRSLIVAGFDEAGRGPLAGPVVAACVVFSQDIEYIEIDDSKRVTKEARKQMEKQIKNKALAYAICEASVEEIDELNILEATKLAMKRCLDELSINPDLLLLDAINIDSTIRQESIIKGDQKSLCIGAASILAKEYRDNIMNEIHNKYPQYAFNSHVGYGTKRHIEAIKEYGAIKGIHRQSFAPISEYL